MGLRNSSELAFSLRTRLDRRIVSVTDI